MYHTLSLQLLEHDILTFPVNGKHPSLSKDWTDFTEEDVEEASEKSIGLGTAVPCGSKSGMVFIDIDTEDTKLQAIILNFIDENFPSALLRYGNKKRLPSMLYAYDGQRSKKIMRGRKAIIEILSNGRYCVIDGDHPEQKEPYEWNRDLLEIVKAKDHWPIFTDEHIRRLGDVIDRYFEDQVYKTESIKTDYEFKVREKEGKDACCHDSHNYLFGLICTLLDQTEGDDLIHKVMEADHEINGSRGLTSYYEDRKRGATHGDNILEACTNHVNGIRETINARRKRDNLPEIVPFIPLHLRTPVIEVGKKRIKVIEKKVVETALPKAPGGALQDMFQAVYESSPIKRSRLSLCSALNIISTGIGTNLTFWGTYANIYSIILAESGSGKNAPIKAIHRAMHLLGRDHLIGEQNIVSTKGVIAELDVQPERIDCIDEFGRLLKKANDRGSNISDVFDIYNSLFSDVSGYFAGAKIDMGGKRVRYGECNNPYVNFVGATTPSAFRESFNEEMFLQGWGSRALMFCDLEFKKSSFENSNHYLTIPDSVKRLFMNLRGEPTLDKLRTTPQVEIDGRKEIITKVDNRPKPFAVEAELSAKMMLRDVHAMIEEVKERAHRDDDPLMKTIRSRQYNIIKKVALISSASTNCMNDEKKHCVIRDYDVEYAFNLVGKLGQEAKEFMTANMFKSSHDMLIKKIVAKIEKSRDQGLTASQIIIALPEFRKGDMIDAINWIVEFRRDVYKSAEGSYYSKRFVTIVEN